MDNNHFILITLFYIYVHSVPVEVLHGVTYTVHVDHTYNSLKMTRLYGRNM